MWEYQVCKIWLDQSEGQIIKELDDYGDAGYELVSVVMGPDSRAVLFFKIHVDVDGEVTPPPVSAFRV